MCCGGKMVPYGKDTCCGGIFYTTPPYGTCCGGIFYTTPPYGTCCGGKWYVEGTPGECCPETLYDNSGPRYFSNGVEYPSWKNYTQVWINTDTQHCCAGKVAPGGLWTGNPPELSKVQSILKKGQITVEDRVALVANKWADCGEDACYDQKTQSCCPVAPAKDNVETTYKIQPGKASCCVDTPKIKGVDGKMYDCDPTSGFIYNPGSGIPKNCRLVSGGSFSCEPEWGINSGLKSIP
jgi:hypothetical protein